MKNPNAKKLYGAILEAIEDAASTIYAALDPDPDEVESVTEQWHDEHNNDGDGLDKVTLVSAILRRRELFGDPPKNQA